MTESKETRNARVQDRYDELMREGKHGHYETLFRIVREELVRSALAEQPAPVLTDAEIDAIIAKAHDGKVYPQSGTTMPKVMRRVEARAILAAAIPPGHVVVKDEPVAWMFEYPDKRIAPKFDSAPHGGSWKPLYAARPGEKNE